MLKIILILFLTGSQLIGQVFKSKDPMVEQLILETKNTCKDFYMTPLPFSSAQIDTIVPTKELGLYIQQKCKGLGIFNSTECKLGLFFNCNSNGKIEKLIWSSFCIPSNKEQLFHSKLTEVISEFTFSQKPTRCYNAGGVLIILE